MIELTLADIAAITGGEVISGDDTRVTAEVVIDSRRAVAGSLFVAIAGEHTDGHDHAGAAIANGAVATLGTKPVAGPCIVVKDATQALADLAQEVLARLRAAGQLTVIAVTGSQGKTSVKDMLAHVLEHDAPTVAPEGSFNNELGVPLTVLRATTQTRWLVLEMGARGLGHIAQLCRIAPPDIAIVANVGTAHLGEFGSVEVIGRAKSEIVAALPESGTAILNRDDLVVSQMGSTTRARVIGFGHIPNTVPGDVRLVAEAELDDAGYPVVEIDFAGERWTFTVPQIGHHHAMNAAAVFAAAAACEIAPNEIANCLATAKPRSPMRMERTVAASGAVILNDAYNANPESMAAALKTLAAVGQGRKIAVLGAMLELGEESELRHRELGELACSLGIDEVLAVGPGAEAIALGAGDRGRYAQTVDVAVSTLRASLRQQDTVLVKASRGIRLEEIVKALSL